MEKSENVCDRITVKNYFTWEFQFQLFVKDKELWGKIYGYEEVPAEPEKLAIWNGFWGQLAHIILNICPYRTKKQMWEYLKRVYNQENNARGFQLELEITNFIQGSWSIQDYYSSFLNLWTEYSDIIYAKVPNAALPAIQEAHETSKWDHVLMKLISEFETTRSALMSHEQFHI